MTMLEFDAQIPSDGTLKVPPDIASQIPENDPVHVVLVVGEQSDDDAWRKLTVERFAAGYSESDAIYDDL